MAISLVAAGRATKYMRWPLWAAAACGFAVAFISFTLIFSAGHSMEFTSIILCFAFLTLMGQAAAVALFISIVPVSNSPELEETV